MHSAFLTQIIRSSSRLRWGQSPWAVCTGLAKQPQAHAALERQIYWCCFHHQLRIKIYEKQRKFFWQQGHLSLLPSPAAAVLAKLGLLSPTPLSCLYSVPDDSGRNLPMVCNPLCGKIPLFPHDWDVSRKVYLSSCPFLWTHGEKWSFNIKIRIQS